MEIDKELSIISDAQTEFKTKLENLIFEKLEKMQSQMTNSLTAKIHKDNSDEITIDHDLIDAVETGMREYINNKLDLYVSLNEVEG
jgi:hypothetical protein